MELKIINQEEKQLVSARELHKFMEVKTHFKDWMARRVLKYGFKENEDFIATAQKRATAQGNMTEEKEYLITLDMAKELSMIENNEKGRQARKYFIACEKNYIHMLEARMEAIENAKNKDYSSVEWQLLKSSAENVIKQERKIKEDIAEIRKILSALDAHRSEIYMQADQVLSMVKRLEDGERWKKETFIEKGWIDKKKLENK